MHDPRQQMIARIATADARADHKACRRTSEYPEALFRKVPDFDPESDDAIYYADAYRAEWKAQKALSRKVVR